MAGRFPPRSRASRNRFTPSEGDSIDTLCKKAFRCGRELKPSDWRSKWMDDLPSGEDRNAIIDSYHEGQMEQFEQEDW